MDSNEFMEFDVPSDELLALLQSSQNRGEKVRIRIPKQYLVDSVAQKKRPLQINEGEIVFDGDLLSLSPNRFNFLRSFANNDCVAEAVIGKNIYKDELASHAKIKKVADQVEKDLSNKISFEYSHGNWTIIFNIA